MKYKPPKPNPDESGETYIDYFDTREVIGYVNHLRVVYAAIVEEAIARHENEDESFELDEQQLNLLDGLLSILEQLEDV
jgi:hypothetical protein